MKNLLTNKQDSPTQAKIVRKIELLEEFGNTIGLPHSKKVAPDLFELRITGTIQARIFYCFHTRGIYLLHAFTKKDQKLPKKELAAALKVLKGLKGH